MSSVNSFGKKYRNLSILIMASTLLWLFKELIGSQGLEERIPWMFSRFQILPRIVIKEPFLEWSPKTLPPRELKGEQFVLSRDQDVYMYSAFVNIHTLNKDGIRSNETSILITTLDSSDAKLNCCVLYSDKRTLFSTPVDVYYENSIWGSTDSTYVARQLTCNVPESSLSSKPLYLTLAATNCSSEIKDYIPIQTPNRVPGGLALCAKIAHSGGLDPEKFIEWIEVQRILGVDKILMFDLGNPENITRVFRYYQKLGILDLQPYELPGLPKDRSLLEKWKHTPQFNHDETMVLFECRQRMAGYDYVISHDVDEFIIPRKNVTLKEFVKEKLVNEPNAAGFYFHTEFFIIDWEPTNPEEVLMVKRYRLSTVPRWERYKYVYLPSRVWTTITHIIYTISDKYTGSNVAPQDAILHHYRRCPWEEWGTCSVQTNVDDTMIRYRDLDQRVLQVIQATLSTPI